MAWTAEVVNVEKQNDLVLVTVEYTDGIRTKTETYKSYGAPPEEWIEKTVDTILARLNGADQATISVGTVEKPTPIDEGRVAYIENVRKLCSLQPLLEMGVVAANRPNIKALIDAIEADFDKYF